MANSDGKTSVDTRLSSALERLERLTEDHSAVAIDHIAPKTVEEAVDRLKKRVPDAGDA